MSTQNISHKVFTSDHLSALVDVFTEPIYASRLNIVAKKAGLLKGFNPPEDLCVTLKGRNYAITKKLIKINILVLSLLATAGLAVPQFVFLPVYLKATTAVATVTLGGIFSGLYAATQVCECCYFTRGGKKSYKEIEQEWHAYYRKAEFEVLKQLEHLDPTKKADLKKLGLSLTDKALGRCLPLMGSLQVYYLFRKLGKSHFHKVLEHSNDEKFNSFWRQITEELQPFPKETLQSWLSRPEDFFLHIKNNDNFLKLIFHVVPRKILEEESIGIRSFLNQYFPETDFNQLITECTKYSPQKEEAGFIEIQVDNRFTFWADPEVMRKKCEYIKIYLKREEEDASEAAPLLEQQSKKRIEITLPEPCKPYCDENLSIILKCLHHQDNSYMDKIHDSKQWASMYYLANYLLCTNLLDCVKERIISIMAPNIKSIKQLKEAVCLFPDFVELHKNVLDTTLTQIFPANDLEELEELIYMTKTICMEKENSNPAFENLKTILKKGQDQQLIKIAKACTNMHPLLNEICLEFLKQIPDEMISSDNIEDLSELSLKYSLMPLKDKCRSFIKNMLGNARKEKEFRDLCSRAAEGTELRALIQSVAERDRQENSGSSLTRIWPGIGKIPEWLLTYEMEV